MSATTKSRKQKPSKIEYAKCCYRSVWNVYASKAVFFSLFIFMFINPWLFVNVLVRLNKSGGCLYLFFTVSFQLSDVPIVFSSTLQGRSVLKVPDSPKSRKSPRFLRRDQSHHRLLMLMINVFQVILFLKISNLQ